MTVARILPLGEDPAARSRAALAQLAVLIDLYDRGMREPLPLASDASAAYAQAAAAGDDGAAAADKAWTSTFDYPKEDRKPEHLLVYGGEIPLAGPAGDQARAPTRTGTRTRPSRFGVYARRLWAGLLAREEIERPMTDGLDVHRLRRLRSAALGRDGARGERRHRQDVHDRRADRALRGRGNAARPAAADHVHADGDRRAARPGPRAAGRRASRRCRGSSPARPTSETDPVVTLLASGSPDDIGVRRDRLARAVADFDAATIATTHGFCQEVLAELGTVGDLDRETAFVEDVSDPARAGARRSVRPALSAAARRRRFNRAEALQIARAAVDNPMAELEPRDEPTDSTAAMRYRLAKAVRSELEQRKRRLAIMTYDDLLTRLKDTLDGPSGEAARARLRSRFDVVLVDEFQDTDPIQWQILDRAFAKGGVTLVLVADPKQAIYAFRGADVYAYLKAAEIAGARATLRDNRRTDQTLIDAYDALFAGARLGHEGIVVPPGPGHAGAPDAPPDRRAQRCRAPRAGRPPRRSHDRADPERVRRSRTRPGRTSPAIWPPTSSRCCPRTRESSTAPPTASRSATSRCARATSRCSSAETRTPSTFRTNCSRRASRRSSTAPAACSRRGRRATGWACWRRSSGPPRRSGREPRR